MENLVELISGKQYRREIDGLRAVAVISVMLYHAGMTTVSGGFVGVDIFFVISGYLITSIICIDIANGEFTFLKFYERRVRRIFPALFFLLVVSAAIALLVYSPRQLKEFGQSLVATVTFTSNIYFPLKVGYFAEDAEHVALLHMWSLSVEEQFYVLFPIVLILFSRLKAFWLTVALSAIALVSLGSAMAADADHAAANFFWTHSRAWELLAGALVALHRERWLPWLGKHRQVSIVAELLAGLLIGGSIFFLGRDVSWPGIATVPVVGGTALLILVSNPRLPVGRMLSTGPFVGIGLISYSAYLWHQPLFAFARVGAGRSLTSVETFALLATTLGIALLSWRHVERPFRSGAMFSRRFVFGTGMVATAGTVVTGLALYAAQGLPQRYDAKTRAMAVSMSASPFRDKCHTDGAAHIVVEKACRYFTDDVSWAMFSDSEGVELAYALAERQRAANKGVLHLTFSGCFAALTYAHPGPGCNEWTRHTVDWLERHGEITHVMIVYRWSYHLFGDQLKTYPNMPDEHPKFLEDLTAAAARDQSWSSFVTLVDRLRAAGKTVVIIRPIPDLPVAVERYVYHGLPANGATGMTRVQADARNAWTNAHLDTLVGRPGVRLINPVDTLCDALHCWSIRDGQALYIDDNHPSVVGARQIIANAAARGLLD